MSIDWERHFRELVDLGSETYEQRVERMALKIAGIVLFLIVAWRLITWR